MQETVGKTDDEMAFERDDRADHWSPRQSSSDNLQYFSYGTASHSQGGGRSGGGWGANNGWSHGHRGSSSSGLGQPGHMMSFDDNLGESSNKPSFQIQPHSPNPSQQRPSMKGGPPSFPFNGPHGLSGDREYGPHGGPNRHGSSVGYNHRNSEYMSPDFPSGPPGMGGSFGYGKDGHEQPEFGPHNQGSGYGYGVQNEYGNRKSHSEEQETFS
jgi:hypothetical protein